MVPISGPANFSSTVSFLPVQGISMFVETQLNKHFKFSEHVL